MAIRVNGGTPVSLTSFRQTDDTPFLYVSPTEGMLRLNQPAAEMMKINYAKVTDKEGPGVRVDVLKHTTNDENVSYYIFVTSDGDGSKLAQAGGKNGGSLSFSSANAYSVLGGKPTQPGDTETVTKVYSPGPAVVIVGGDGVNVTLEEAVAKGMVVVEGGERKWADDGSNVDVLYQLTFEKDEFDAIRKKSEKAAEATKGEKGAKKGKLTAEEVEL